MPPLFAGRHNVTAIPAANSQLALAHFERLLGFETDCWDVHVAIESGDREFVLLDVRSPELFEAGHIPTAVNLPHRRINQRNLAKLPKDTLFVVYCGGPHCNGADQAAIRLARLGVPVKKMIGGIEGWKDEGFALEAEVGADANLVSSWTVGEKARNSDPGTNSSVRIP